MYQKSWLSYHTIFKALIDHEFIHYNEYSPTLDIIDTTGAVTDSISITHSKYPKNFSEFLYSSIDSTIVGLLRPLPCDFFFLDTAYIVKFNRKGKTIWKSKGLYYGEYNLTSLNRYKNGYLFTMQIDSSSSTSNLNLSFINEKGVVKDYPSIKFSAKKITDVKIYGGNNIVINTIDKGYLVDTLGNIKYSSNASLSSLAKTFSTINTTYISTKNALYKKDSLLNTIDSATFFKPLLPYKLIGVDTTLWLFAHDLFGNGWIYKYYIKFDLIDSIQTSENFGTILAINNSNIFSSGYDKTYDNGRPLLKSFDVKTLKSYKRNQFPVITNLRFDSLKTEITPNGPFYLFNFRYSFKAIATIKNSGTTALKSIFLNTKYYEMQFTNDDCPDVPYFLKFDNLNVAVGDSVDLKFIQISDITSGSNMKFVKDSAYYTLKDFYLWCSAPNNEVKMNSSLEDTVKINILMNALKNVGISEIKQSNNLTCFPNPFSNSFTIKYSSDKTELVYCKLIDAQGRIVKDFTITSNTNIELGDESLTKGMYVLSTYSNTNGYAKVKLLKE